MKAAAFTLFTGLVLTLGGVGGIEHNEDITSAAIVTAVGLLAMWVGTKMIPKEQL